MTQSPQACTVHRAEVDVFIPLFLTTGTCVRQTAKDYESSALTN